MRELPPLDRTERTKANRLPERTSYDRKLAHAILDEGLVAHVAFVVEGQPFVIPMAYARDGDRILLHGSAASRLLRAGASGAALALAVTLLDGIVLARSAFHHSMNYRSVVVLGRAEAITDPAAKRRALDLLVDHVAPGRSGDARAPSEKELSATTVIELPLEEGSVKVRAGGPKDDARDLSLPCWAGVIPLELRAGEPEPAAGAPPSCPPELAGYSRKRR